MEERKKLKKGDRVRVSDLGFEKQIYGEAYRGRLGSITSPGERPPVPGAHLTAPTITVRWDGRKSVESVSTLYIELAPAGS